MKYRVCNLFVLPRLGIIWEYAHSMFPNMRVLPKQEKQTGLSISRVYECRVSGKNVARYSQSVPRPECVHSVALVGQVLARMRPILGASAIEFIWWRGTSCERVHSHWGSMLCECEFCVQLGVQWRVHPGHSGKMPGSDQPWWMDIMICLPEGAYSGRFMWYMSWLLGARLTWPRTVLQNFYLDHCCMIE